MKLIEIINDQCHTGFGILVYPTPFDARCLFGVFRNKEQRFTELHFLFLKFRVE